MTQSDVADGDPNLVVGFAPDMAADLVVIAITALAGPSAPDVGELPRAAHDTLPNAAAQAERLVANMKRATSIQS